MAARKMPFHPDEVRQKIQASQLVNRLQDHVFGKNDMTATQLKAAEVLLRKTVPDLSAVQHSGDTENPVNVVTRVELVAKRT